MATNNRPRVASARILLLLAGSVVLWGGQARAAGLLVADGGFGGQLEIQQHSVRVEVDDGVAVVEVVQVFRNTEDRVVEALYTFPVPPGASVADFSMWINGKEMVGEVVEKQRARQIYDSYKPLRRDPGLLEKIDARTLQMRIFPIGPRATEKVRVRYYQDLRRDQDRVTFTYPLHMDDLPAAGGAWRASQRAGKFSLHLDVRSRLPLASMESPSHRDQLATAVESELHWQASLEASGKDLDKDVVVRWALARPQPFMDLTASRSAGEDGYFRLTLTPGEELAAPQAGQDYVFLVDASGSMGEESKLACVQEAVRALVEALTPADRFEIVAFDMVPRGLFGSPLPASAPAVDQARTFLANLRARGSTDLEPALAAAWKCARPGRALTVIVFTDAETEYEDWTQLAGSLGGLEGGARVCTVGVGGDPKYPMLERLAAEAGGWQERLRGEGNAREFGQALAGRLARPWARAALEFTGVEVYDAAPSRLTSLIRGEPVCVYGRYRGSGRLQVTLRAWAGETTLIRTVEADLPAEDAAHHRIERMWAARRVDELLAQTARQDPATQQRMLWEIVRLGEAYSIVTEYTSFLVLENDAEYQRWKLDRANLLRLDWDRAAGGDVQERLRALREKAMSLSGGARPGEGAPLAAPRSPARVVPQAAPQAPPPLQTAPPAAPQLAPSSSGQEFRPDLPKPHFEGTPRNFRVAGLRPRQPARHIYLPPGVKVTNLARGMPVTSSDPEPIIGELPLVTDGDKEGYDGSYVELGPGLQWVQIDLKRQQLIRFILLWHYHRDARVYRDVIVQVSDDKDFVHGVTTLFNNDHDNSAGLGIGRDWLYIDDYQGELIQPARPVRARYVRLYSNGNTSNDMNHYTEVEVYGTPGER